MDEMAPTLLRLPDLCPPTGPEETFVEDSSAPEKLESDAGLSMQDMLDAATEVPTNLDTTASVSRLPNLVPPQTPVTSPEVTTPGSASGVRTTQDTTSQHTTPQHASIQNATAQNTPSVQPVLSPPSATATVLADSKRTEAAPKTSWKESSETFGNRALAVVGSRNTLLVLLAVLACWAVFAPRRNPNAQQNSEALIAKDPEVDRSAAKKDDLSSVNSIASDNANTRPKKHFDDRKAANNVAVSENTNPKPSVGQVKPRLSMTAGTPKHSVNKTTLGQPSATNTMGAAPGGTSLVQSQLASSTMQHGVNADAPFGSVPFHQEVSAEAVSPSVREPQVASSPSNVGMSLDALAANYAAGSPSEITAEEFDANEATTSQGTSSGSEALTTDVSPTDTPSFEETPPAVPVPLQTGTPGPISNWMDYLPPMPSETGDQASNAAPADAGSPAATVAEQVAGANEFPATRSPSTPDFRFALPGDGPEGSVGNQTPATSDQPEARVAAPPFYPDFNLRR
ncbi:MULTISPECIES: hypothetical protein [Rhodopirellula]|jgi:hypothetical protein